MLVNKNMVVYFDMDNVLADFGKEENALERFKNEKGFFSQLTPIEKNVAVVNALIKLDYKVKIISASPNSIADNDKMVWLSKHIPLLDLKNVILCRPFERKCDYVNDIENSLLVDDYTKNLIEWKSKGGKVLKYICKYDNLKGKHIDHAIPFVRNLGFLLK